MRSTLNWALFYRGPIYGPGIQQKNLDVVTGDREVLKLYKRRPSMASIWQGRISSFQKFSNKMSGLSLGTMVIGDFFLSVWVKL
jgi:hypothetical protein